MKHIASCSFGKDSLAMVLMLIEREYPLDEVVFYDTGKEFQAIYNLRDRVLPIFQEHGVKFTELQPPMSFDYMMFDHVTSSGKIGYGWCGGICRWGTTYKIAALDKIGENSDVRYVGIAVDEPMRLEKEYKGNKKFPLAEWDMTERDCLDYCFSKGFHWKEASRSRKTGEMTEIELYSILDRVSCWCCRNKNLKELKGIYRHLPEYWRKLKEIQARLPEPMKGYYDKEKTRPKGIFELETRFEYEIRTGKKWKRQVESEQWAEPANGLNMS